MSSRHTIRALVLANGCVALITSSGALVVLLIAPLGLAAVISCTVLVALLAFCAGLATDVVLLRLLLAKGSDAGPDEPTASFLSGGSLPLLDRRPKRLPERRP